MYVKQKWMQVAIKMKGKMIEMKKVDTKGVK
jgi:hypothetical protein